MFSKSYAVCVDHIFSRYYFRGLSAVFEINLYQIFFHLINPFRLSPVVLYVITLVLKYWTISRCHVIGSVVADSFSKQMIYVVVHTLCDDTSIRFIHYSNPPIVSVSRDARRRFD